MISVYLLDFIPKSAENFSTGCVKNAGKRTLLALDHRYDEARLPISEGNGRTFCIFMPKRGKLRHLLAYKSTCSAKFICRFPHLRVKRA
jgi:hypothetical protein